jgi:capsular exopolysaccharide synthesis family protein
MMLDAREKLKSQMGDASSHLVRYRMLKNEAMANAQLYNTLEGRLKEAGIYAGLRSSNIRIVDLAAVPEKPASPHRALIILGGGAASFLFSIVLAFVRQTLDNKIRTPDDIKHWTGLTSLAALPRIGAALPQTSTLTDVSTRGTPSSPFHSIISMGNLTPEGEAIRQLRTALLSPNGGAVPRAILVSSASAGEGKSTIAVNLAIVLARSGNTCLMDADIRQPVISTALGLETKDGLSQLLRREAVLEDCITKVSTVPNLFVVPAGRLNGNPADSLSSEEMNLLADDLTRFDFVVVDSPPAIPFSDARILSSVVDAVVIVGRCGVTTRRSLVRCARLFSEVHAPIFGVVLNDIDYASADFDYYTYGYTKLANGGGSRDSGQRPSSRPDPEPSGGKAHSAHA